MPRSRRLRLSRNFSATMAQKKAPPAVGPAIVRKRNRTAANTTITSPIRSQRAGGRPSASRSAIAPGTSMSTQKGSWPTWGSTASTSATAAAWSCGVSIALARFMRLLPR